jgi:putative transposase
MWIVSPSATSPASLLTSSVSGRFAAPSYYETDAGVSRNPHTLRRKSRCQRDFASDSDHKVYPYLLRGLSIEKPNQVWCADITYIPMAKGFVYLVAVMDWCSRRVLAWRVSITMEADFCVEALQEAITRHGQPKIFNTDQGVQFTSAGFLDELESRGIRVSMDGKGRFLDNIFIERLWRSLKYEDVVCCERVVSA